MLIVKEKQLMRVLEIMQIILNLDESLLNEAFGLTNVTT